MKGYPHHYYVRAELIEDSDVNLECSNLDTIVSAPPLEFDGPGDRWSPETLLIGALVDCFALSFRAAAKGSRFSWAALSCEAEGVLDKVDVEGKGVAQFTGFFINANLTLFKATDNEMALKLLEKAKRMCVITNSLKATTRLKCNLGVAI